MPALQRWRQEDYKFEANLGYIVKSFLKKCSLGSGSGWSG